MTDLVRSEPVAMEAEHAAETLLCVVFRVGSSEYALPAETVRQMESFQGATAVPGAPPFIVGVVQVRGRIVPVIDLRLRFGAPVGEATLENRIVVGELGERAVALLVDSAREVLAIPRTALKPPPPLLDSQARGFVQAIAQVGQRLIMLVDFGRVIEEEGVRGD